MNSRLKNAHESSILTYGHFGTATYDEDYHEWRFTRLGTNKNSTDAATQPKPTKNENGIRVLLTSTPWSPTGTTQPTITNERQRVSNLSKRTPELAAALSWIKDESKQTPNHIACQHNLGLLAIGNIPLLEGNTKAVDFPLVPVAIFCSGANGEILSIVTISSDAVEMQNGEERFVELILPLLDFQGAQSWTDSYEPICQIQFSCSVAKKGNNPFLAIRRLSNTAIIQPAGHRRSSAALSNDSTLDYDFEKVAQLSTSATGGATHIDIQFHPRIGGVFTIVDIEGNWSVWKISGRRHASAKRTYLLTLQSSGRVFAWTGDSRPEHIGQFFDGWHRISWIGEEQSSADKLLVCNRRQAYMFSVEGWEVGQLNCRLGNLHHAQLILDMHCCLQSTYSLILTSSSILLFDTSQKDWKAPHSDETPLLVVAWNHFRSENDLRMAILETISHISVITYSTSPLAPTTLYAFELDKVRKHARSYDPQFLKLQLNPDVSISSMRFESINPTHRLTEWTNLLTNLFIIYDNQSIQSALVELPYSQPHFGTGIYHTGITVPSSKASKYQSQKYVNDDDMSEFVLEKEDDKSTPYESELPSQTQTLVEPQRIQRTIDISKTYKNVVAHSIDSGRQKSPLSNVMQNLDKLLSNLNLDDEFCTIPLSALVPNNAYIEDIDLDSKRLDEKLSSTVSSSEFSTGVELRATHFYITSGMLEVYEHLVEKFVSRLADSIPSRIRLYRERSVRDLALDLQLSQYVTARNPGLGPSKDGVENFPDPDVPTDWSDPHRNKSSQASVVPDLTFSLEDIQKSSLSTAVLRLSTVTTISNPPMNTLSNPASEVLAHIPSDPIADPSTYDYRSTELMIAVSRNQALEESLDPRTRRKIEKLAKARKRATERLQQVKQAAKSQSTATPSVSTNQTQIPLRQVQSSQLQPPSSPSSAQFDSAMIMTQPERGTHGERQSKVKSRRTQRPAGFR